MCLIAFAWRARPGVPLVVAANRDELHARPTSRAAEWAEAPSSGARVLGGRDLEAGGTWLAVTRPSPGAPARFAAVTNHRDGLAPKGGPSRGMLVRDFVLGDDGARAYLERRARDGFRAFNVIASDGEELWSLADDGALVAIEPGVHALSNARVDEAWPKVRRACAALGAAIAGPEDALFDDAFAMLADRTVAPDAELPDTNVGLALERALSPCFIVSPVYGTRSSTVVLVGDDGRVVLEERSFAPDGSESARVRP